MATDKEVIEEIMAFRTAVEKLVKRFPRAKFLNDTEICGYMAALMSATAGLYASISAISHMINHEGDDCARGIIGNIGIHAEEETRTIFEKLLKAQGLESPFEDERELSTNEQTMNEILNMIAKAGEQSNG